MSQNEKLTYAETMASSSIPKKKEIIILESVDGLTIKEYVSAIGNHIGPNLVRFVSRIS